MLKSSDKKAERKIMRRHFLAAADNGNTVYVEIPVSQILAYL